MHFIEIYFPNDSSANQMFYLYLVGVVLPRAIESGPAEAF